MITTVTRDRIGFMQGRLSPLVDGRIQAFPYGHWQSEFEIGASAGYSKLELTLDYEDPYENPMMTKEGRREICALKDKFRVATPSATGDCFMQRPFWKCVGSTHRRLVRDLYEIIDACHNLKVRVLVIPLVDNGSVTSGDEERVLIDVLTDACSFLKDANVCVAFESDKGPEDLAAFINNFDEYTVGINYDVGNSASLGFDPEKEIFAYGSRILNVHVKDRKYEGATVPLGEGDARFAKAFNSLTRVGYSGNFILQTARSSVGEHLGDLNKYRDFTLKYLV